MRNFESYYQRMAINIPEKIDFICQELTIRKYTHVLDFGCANGATTKEMAKLFPEIQFLGYDLKEVIAKNSDEGIKNLKFIDELPVIEEKERYMIVFSSVLHEISYALFYKMMVLNFEKAKAIAIRDMYSNLKDMEKVIFQLKIIKKLYKDNKDFETKENYFFINWGLIEEIVCEKFINFYDFMYVNEFVASCFPEKKHIFTHRKMIFIKPINVIER